MKVAHSHSAALLCSIIWISPARGQSETAPAIEQLATLAEDEGHEALGDAVSGLREQRGDTYALHCLAALLKLDDFETQVAAAWVCGQLELDVTPILDELLEAITFNAGYAVARLGSGRLPELLAEILVSDPDADVLWALSSLAADAETAVPVLTDGLSHDDVGVRWRSANLLGDIGANTENKSAGWQDAVERLIDILQTEPRPRSGRRYLTDSDVREAAASALGDIAMDAERVVPLLEGFLEHPEFEMRRAASSGLGGFGSSAASTIPKLVELLRDTPDEGPFCATCGIPPSHWAGSALVRIGRESVPALCEAMQSEHQEVRHHAANALLYLGENAHDAIPALIEATQSDDEKLRYQALVALGYLRLRLDLTIPALMQALEHNDANTRKQALYAFWFFGAEAQPAVEAIRRALGDEVADVREEAERTLREIESEANGD